MVDLKPTDEGELKKEMESRLQVLAGEQQERIAQRRADELGLPYISLLAYPIDPDVLEQVPRERAKAAGAVLFYQQSKDVRIGAVNPALPKVKELVTWVTEKLAMEPELYVISHRSLLSSLARYRREQEVEEVPRGEMVMEAGSLDTFERAVAELEELGKHISSLPPTEVLEAVVAGAVVLRASDLHLEPLETEARLRYRIDGVLQDIATFEKEGWKLILSRVKTLASLKLNVHEVPQDGSFVLRVGEKIYDIRLSILPGGFGENIVIRVLDRESQAVKVTALGMKERDYELVQQELAESNGMILVTGPTGSGKTTSLASFITEVNSPDIKIITLEDPIEYRLEGVEQTQIDAAAGYTFAKGFASDFAAGSGHDFGGGDAGCGDGGDGDACGVDGGTWCFRHYIQMMRRERCRGWWIWGLSRL